MTGIVFDIKEFSLHDGPGGRITVFLKGCPLRCAWCHNPEGLSREPQLMVKSTLCSNCRRCYKPCSHPECQPFGRCVHACPNGALSISGKPMEADALANYLNRNADFLRMNNGGVTFSGGEPLMHVPFIHDVIDRIGSMHKAIQTSGFADEETFRSIIDRMDYVMMDLKIIDREQHKKFTGVYNDRILQNFEYLRNSGKEFMVRVPLIPDITDTEENLRAISQIAGDSPVELLKYNTFAGAKYSMLGMEYTLTKDTNNPVDLSIFRNAHFG